MVPRSPLQRHRMRRGTMRLEACGRNTVSVWDSFCCHTASRKPTGARGGKTNNPNLYNLIVMKIGMFFPFLKQEL